MERIAPMLANVHATVERTVLRQYVARRLDLPEAVIEQAVTAKVKGLVIPVQTSQSTAVRLPPTERLLLRTMLTHPATIEETFAVVGPADFTDEWCRTVAALLFAAGKERSPETVSIGALIEGLEDVDLAGELRALLMEEATLQEEEAVAVVRGCAASLKRVPARERLTALNEEIRSAEGTGDEVKLVALLTEKQQLIGRMHTEGRSS
jgi:hypothetical protein